MKKIKVLSVFGTRPEAIKMGPLIKELESRDSITSVVCVTAQHREMLDQVLDIFKIKPDYDFNIMKKGQTLSDITTCVMNEMVEILKSERPDIVLVHGDTTTTFAAGLAAFYEQIDIGHVEAGLRTRNKYSPFPEEMNRQMVDCITDMYFAPTLKSRQNLVEECVNESNIYVTGNTVIDAMSTTIIDNYNHDALKWSGGNRLILLTAHRRENIGNPMKQIFNAVNRITDEFNDVRVIFPVHLNPKVRKIAFDKFKNNERVKLIDPLDVFDFHNFQNLSYLIMTDSGGVQEEAPSLGKPVLVLRDTTERPEGVEAGTLKLVGTNEEDVYKAIKELLIDEDEYKRMSKAVNPYGDGKASKRIVDEIERRYKN